MKARTLLQGAGVAALVLFPFYRSMLDLPNDLRMHSTQPFTSVALSMIANLALVTLVFALAGSWLRHTTKLAWMLLFVPALVLASIAEVIHIAFGEWESTRLWIIVAIALLCLSVVLRRRWPRGERILLRYASSLQNAESSSGE